MSHDVVPPSGDSSPGLEYPSALAALEDRQIFAITPIDGGFEIREKGADEYFVRLLPEQLCELGQEIIALATSALAQSMKEPEVMPEPERVADVPTPVPAPVKSHTITIPPGIWNVRVTEEFQARIAKLGMVEPTEKPIPPKQIKPWIKP